MSAQLPDHASVTPEGGTGPRIYRLFFELDADADLAKALKRIRSAARFGVRVIEARPYDGQMQQLTQTTVKRRENNP